MSRFFRRIDLGLAPRLAAALVSIVLSAWPGAARADDLLVGSGQAATEARPLGEFQAIVLSGGISARIRQAAQASVQVRTDDNLLAQLETVIETRGEVRTLHIRWNRQARLRIRVAPSVDVSVVRLQALAANGSGDVLVEALTTPRLLLSLSGTGNVKLNGLDSNDLGVTIAGSGDVAASGRATRLSIKVSGSGDVDAAALQADEVVVGIAGSGDVSVHADKALAVSIAGSGDVTYGGDAKPQSRIAGSGTVRKR